MPLFARCPQCGEPSPTSPDQARGAAPVECAACLTLFRVGGPGARTRTVLRGRDRPTALHADVPVLEPADDGPGPAPAPAATDLLWRRLPLAAALGAAWLAGLAGLAALGAGDEYLGGLLLASFGCGLLGGLAGHFRGRPAAGVAAGLALGLVGVAAAGLLPGGGPRCPECRGAVEAGARRCRHCRARLG